ncbi:nucleotidyltransferase family protein [uncultured Mitsuokella sp.]|uniref:tRNA(Met) cytidine acetate ligase n=1 Tax=uncultured Mitsuokella sp. TaxID=453120 RepID=UPI0026DB3824|nr:nucleotidyltransferase family protein [uncultured Mitsuokella sp.]
MHVTGIIAEYNPFHNGHAYQLRRIREKRPDTIIAVAMSGSIVQRGTPAVLDKWQRAELAIAGGCDLVCELPFLFACRSAQDFARGGVRLLMSLGISALAFGAESDDLGHLHALAAAIDAPETQERTGRLIREGKSYAQALTAALQGLGFARGPELHEANNILAVEYLRALRGTAVPPFLIQRRGAGYHEADLQELASATAIRQALRTKTPDWTALAAAMPPGTLRVLQEAFPGAIPEPDALLRALKLRLLTLSRDDLMAQYGLPAGEGIENRLQEAAGRAKSTGDFLQGVVTSRYAKSRIQRLIPHLLLQTPRALVAAADEKGPCYLRVLACSARGRLLLRRVKCESPLPLITKVGPFLHSRDRLRLPELPLERQMLAFDTFATELRTLTLPELSAPDDFTRSPRFFKP